ncbi:MAG: M3 family metallopeptidase [Bacteroidetes bacterium]|nr:M3 family metallopeptidase [Bacteroidota bacterium]
MKNYLFYGSRLALILCSTAAIVYSQQLKTMNRQSSTFSETNPFAKPSTLLYQAPPFNDIHNEDYLPAMEEGMRRQIQEIRVIADNTEAPTFENTILPLERSGDLLTRSSKVFFAMTQANTNDELENIQSEAAPKLAAHSDEIYLNEKLFRRIKNIYDARETSSFTAVQKVLVERYYTDFVRAGALLSEADKEKLKSLNLEESKLTTSFQSKLLAGTKAAALVISNKKELDGMSEAEISAAAQAAKERGLEGKWVLPLQNTTQQPAQAELKNRAVRERLFNASTLRSERSDSNDTRDIITKITKIRAERAQLLGFQTFADYVLENRMAKTPSAAIKLLTDLVPAATAKARKEAKKMQTLINKQKNKFLLEPWDWQYYSEQVRKAEYDLDEVQIKPYFELNTVLQQGVFYAAHELYGLTFKERKDIPVYHPDVRVFEVFDEDGTSMALWYCDYFKRDNKGGGAWEDTFVDGSGLLKTKTVVFNVCNFSKPETGSPALLTFDNVTTMFHEFGHALHAMLTNVEYPRLAGTNTATDFVEFPSQFNENWALYPSVLANYAKHYKTGKPMPKALVEKIKKANTFNQGFATTEYVEAALLDMAWNTLSAGSVPGNVDEFETASLKKYNVYMKEVPPRYRSTYFAHVWGGGYAAGYYSYMWSEVLDHDAYQWFVENGGMTRANGKRFREMILSRGGTEDAGALYRAFRGRDPIVQPLLEARGLTTK